MYLRRVSQLQHEVDQLFDALAGPWRPPKEPFWRGARLFPLLNVKRTSDGYEVTAEIPGMKTEDLDIKVEGDILTLKGERKAVDLPENASYHRKERATGTFQRTITLPGRVDEENVQATYRCGVLTVTLPQEKPATARRITVRNE